MRLIDADKLEKVVSEKFKERYGNTVYQFIHDFFRFVIRQIRKAPTIDAVPVVRCKDCKHYSPQKKSAHWNCTTLYCNRVVTMKVSPDDFCSYGERKEDEE
jgi:hypothetical protein